MLESYLHVSHYCVFFLAISASFDSASDKISTWIRIVLLAIYLLWPLFITVFLYTKRNMLDDKEFIKKVREMFD